ncbi:MAG: hypothetical protein WCI66_01310 [Gammaproteobacteria bacterium]
MKLQRSALLKTGCLLGAVILSFTVLAQTNQLELELGKCSVITDISARVACYDNLARPRQEAAGGSQAPTAKVVESVPTSKAAEPAPAVKTAAAVRAEPEAAKIEKFGQQQAKIEANSHGEEVLVGKVAALKETGSNKLQITLANGQVWQQTIGKSFFLQENDTVRISPSAWGNSYRLEKDDKPGFIQVSRLH